MSILSPLAMSPACGRFALVAALLLLFAGCSTHATRLRNARDQFYLGKLDAARQQLDKATHGWNKDADCLVLDKAVIQLVDGQPREAEQSLRQVRDRLEYLEQQDLAENAISMLTDDNRRAYTGEDYEKVLLRVFLALANLMHDGQDAVAYGLQIEEKQRQIIERGLPGERENPKLSYKQVAMGPYLEGILREATHADYDDAARSFAKVASWQPDFRPAVHDLARAERGRHSQPGNGVVYVFTLVGRGPYKVEAVEEPTSAALLIADRMLSALGTYPLPPTIVPIKVPQVVIPRNEIDGVRIDVNGQWVGVTQTITDVGDLAVSQHQALRPHLVARAVVRRVVKKSVAYGAQDGLHVENPWISLGIMAAGVAWEFTESADTRCWGLLPEKIQVLRLELPAGTHALALQPARGTSALGARHTTEVEVFDGRNTYLLACFPHRDLVGKIVVSNP